MNTLTIARKEIQSYFRSPIAYGVMAFFALIAGYFFYASVVFFVRRGMEMAMMGQSQPMDLNEYVVRPLLSNISVIALFLIPMITMRLFAEEKRSGTIELLLTSPLRDWEILLGKFLGAMALYSAMLGISFLSMLILFAYGKPDWRPLLVGLPGPAAARSSPARHRNVHLKLHQESDCRRRHAGFAVCLMLWILNWVSESGTTIPERVLSYIAVTSHFRIVRQRSPGHEGRHILPVRDFHRIVSNRALHGSAPVEGINI